MNRAASVERNPMRYVWFTTLYNARAYYPILAILFIDLGLTLDQYVLLNFVWAASIFIFEVPSGALADTLGRKNLLVAASILMIAEMSCLLFAPKDGGWLLVGLCITNRFLSGLSEAAASGADEALAYDSLPEAARENAWDKILATSMRYRSVGYVVAMILGGVLYDPSLINQLLPEKFHLSTTLAHRLPIVLVLMQAIACLYITLRMVEPNAHEIEGVSKACANAFKLTLQTAKWVFTNPATRVIIIIGFSIDAVVRNFATINSSYYRMIHLPEWTYGFIGAALGLFGYVVPTIAAKLNQRYSTLSNLALISSIALIGLIGIIPASSIWCLLPAMFLMTTLGFLRFTMSRALNRATDSSKRATVLSVKGLAFNLAYGSFGLGFSLLLAANPPSPIGSNALQNALFWQVPLFALVTTILILRGKAILMKHDRGTNQ
jgi:MFS family permease